MVLVCSGKKSQATTREKVESLFILAKKCLKQTATDMVTELSTSITTISTLYSINTYLKHKQQTAFENNVGKEEITHNEHFVPFPQCFLLNKIIVSPFVHIFDIIPFFAAELEEPKIGISGKGLNANHKQ